MSDVAFRELVGLAEMKMAYPLIQQLNPELDEATFQERLAHMLAEGGYRCIDVGGENAAQNAHGRFRGPPG
jgi:hypothetical protein